jgi:hypothetical protein
MKPYNAIEFTTPCDISSCGFETALELIKDRLKEEGVSCKWGGRLVIGVEGCISTALRVAEYHGASVSMNRTYESDEWSLTMYREGDHKPITAWSGGA